MLLAKGLFSVCCCLLACPLLSQARRSSSARSPAAENQVFDANRVPPLKLLRDLYEKNRVLVIAFPSHNYETQYQILDSLLQIIGHDPRLKRIILERSNEDAPMLEAASTTALTIPDLISRFAGKDPLTSQPSTRRASFSLCLDGEFAYTWAKFLPHIQMLNAHRPPHNQLLVTSIDGVSASQAAAPTTLSDVLAAVEGEGRETKTSANFWNTLWPTLGPSAKVIMLYHVAHTIKTFTVVDDNGQQVPSDWMGMLLRDHPTLESQIGIVLLDPVDSVNGVLRFTQRQGARYPGQAFGISLASFRGILTQADTATFLHGILENAGSSRAVILWQFGGHFHSSRSLPAMLDGVIGLPDVSPWKFGPNTLYLPQCGAMNFTTKL